MMGNKTTDSELELTEREIAIMDEAFMMGRVSANCGEKEMLQDIDEKLLRNCKLKANGVTEGLASEVRVKGVVRTTPATLLKWLEDKSCDLRCVGQPTGGGDYTIIWAVVEHYQAKPKEREIGYGKSPQEAIIDARKDNEDPTKWDYIPN